MSTEINQPPEVIKLLAHDIRWQLLLLLAQSDYRVNELVTAIHEPMNLVSYHLKQLRDAKLVMTRRSDADGRDWYYSLDVEQIDDAFRHAQRLLLPGLSITPTRVTDADQPVRVLFLCSHNSARSQMAEGLMRQLGQGRVTAQSAGSEPTQVHPDAIATMKTMGIDISGQTSRPVGMVEQQLFDYVVTVCDKAREVCPTFPGQYHQIHWSFADPVLIDDPTERRQAFAEIARQLRSRISYFLAALQNQS
jgi:protein-tyrosine-phosphatase/DNA-binding transcriptional ArsR family regulator